MVDSKPCLRRAGAIKMLLLILLMGSLWAATILSEGAASGQTPQPQPLPPPALPPAPLKETAQKHIVTVPTAILGANMLKRLSFNFVIKPDTPLKDLLPIPPKAKGPTGPLLGEDLSQLPEVFFQEPLTKTADALQFTAHTMAKINHLNRKKADGFMEALLGARPDLAGLPVAMGDTCRTKGDRSKFFTQALDTIKRAKGQGNVALGTRLNEVNERLRAQEVFLKQKRDKAQIEATGQPGGPALPPQQPGSGIPAGSQPDQVMIQQLDDIAVGLFVGSTVVTRSVDPDAFWDEFAKLCAQEDKANHKLDPIQREHVAVSRIDALMQVLAPDSVAMRKGLVKFLAGTSHVEATRALAKLAIFSAEDEIRNPAIEALKVRREKDYTEVLLRGLRYPLPAVAKRATEAMTKLERADLITELVNFLEEPDPRAPTIKDLGQKKVPVVREVVRINHHRNCVLCHAPAIQGEVPAHVTTAEVPRPDQPLPAPSEGYNNSIPDILVRLDVTYLRQDFSMLQPVADANPWPEMQRFDFLVRTRELTDQEAKAFPAAKAGALSPYQRAALAALRELTGKDAAPTPEAWRKLLDLPAREVRRGIGVMTIRME